LVLVQGLLYAAVLSITFRINVVHSCCLMVCFADKLCTSKTPTVPQTTSSCGQPAVASEDRYLQSNASVYTDSCCSTNDICTSNCSPSSCTDWRPLLLVIPMRLGLSDVNPIYFDAVKVHKFSYVDRNSGH